MVKTIIIASYLMMKGFDASIDHINDKYIDKELPENVRDVYNADEYKKWREYQAESGRLEDIKNAVSIIAMTAIIAANTFAWVFDQLSGLNIYLQYLVFTFVLTIFGTIFDIPFDYYDTFTIEEKYGLNKSSKATFWLDKLKTLLLISAITYGLTALIMFLFETFGNVAIIMCTGAMLVITLLVALVIVPIMRIYNNFTPLEEGGLKSKLLSLCEKYNVAVRKIVVMDASKRTTESNAFCAGFGNRKTISLDDNLINNYEDEEILAVFAHEFAHAKYKHVLKGLPFTIVRMLFLFAAMGIVLNYPVLYTEFGFDGVNYFWAQTLLTCITWPLSKGLDVVSHYLSRRHEYQADAFAAREGYGEKLISALKRLEKEGLSDINPHPAKVILDYSHPTLSQRITAIEKAQAC